MAAGWRDFVHGCTFLAGAPGYPSWVQISARCVPFMSTSCHSHWRFAATASISPYRFLFLAAMLVADF